MQELIHNEWFVLSMAALLIFGLTQLLKTPIKLATKRIANERVRRMVNATILIIPFALGVVFEIAYSHFVGVSPFSWITYGTAATGAYSFAERFFKVPNPYNTEEGKAAVEFVEAINADGKIDENDTDRVKAYLEKVK